MDANPSIAGKLIVICDDNASLTVLMQHPLRKKRFSVLTAGGGGLNLVRSTAPFNAAELIGRIESPISQGAV